MNMAELTKKLQVLAVKRDVWPSSLDDATLGAMLFDAAQVIPADRVVTERAVTDALTQWLAGNGRMLRFDAVELRRLLVDWQFVERDGFGRAYRRAATHPVRFAEVCVIAATIDFTLLITTAQSLDAEIRAARKATHRAHLAA